VFSRSKRFLKTHTISRKIKILLYKVLIRPVVIYASEIWVQAKKDEEALGSLQRKILRCVFGQYQLKVSGEEDKTLKYIKCVMKEI
jgi:hypothetical protein